MDVISLYTSTVRYIIQGEQEWDELHKLLPYLRQALTCYVCGNILHKPMAPSDTICKHNVCKECVGGKMILKPSCSWCKDYQTYVEKPQLRILVQCFKKLCEYIASTNLGTNLASGHNTGPYGLVAVIQDGIAVQEDNDYATGLRHDLSSLLLFQLPLRTLSPKSATKEKSLKSHNSPRRQKLSPSIQDKSLINDSTDTDDEVISPSSSSSAECTPSTTRITLTKCSTPKTFKRKNHPAHDHLSMAKRPPNTTKKVSRKKKVKGKPKPEQKRGCRCGNATPSPGKLTCYGQRCPCYIARIACNECKCRGCRNPVKLHLGKLKNEIEDEYCEINVTN